MIRHALGFMRRQRLLVLLSAAAAVLFLYHVAAPAPGPSSLFLRAFRSVDTTTDDDDDSILAQGFRPVDAVRCKPSSEGPCDGSFTYVPRQSRVPVLPDLEAREACLRTWDNASVAGAERSRFQEDVLIYEHFFAPSVQQQRQQQQQQEDGTDLGERRRFFFLEMGAYDGLAESNTRLFEACLGWTGLLIEASPPSFEKLKANAPTWRPHSDLLNVAPSSPDFEGFDLPNYSNTGVSMHEGSNGVAQDKIQRVQSGPLSYYLEALGVRKVDFWSLDVEAYEWHVLRTFDFAKVDVEVLMVETDNRFYNHPEDASFRELRQKYIDLLHANGYVEDKRVRVPASAIFVKKGREWRNEEKEGEQAAAP